MKRIFEVLTAAVVAVGGINNFFTLPANADVCVPVKVIWTNGSGSSNDESDMQYVDFRNAVRRELERANYVEDVDFNFYETGSETHGGYRYRADGVGWESLARILTTLGAIFSAGEGYNYGSSMMSGVNELRAYTSEVKAQCPNTKFVLGGLSQGGQVTSTVLEYLDPNDVIYAATFGDPKLYLPEGLGIIPKACYDESSYSFYRAYVPDCYTHDGSLGGRKPYNFSGYEGKLGAWCNWHDAICSSYMDWSDPWNTSLAPHGSYGLQYNGDDLYSDAAIIIRDKVREALGEAVNMPLDIAFVFDNTDSTIDDLFDFQSTAVKIANKAIDSGGSVSIVTYRDTLTTTVPAFEPAMHCGVTSLYVPACTKQTIQEHITSIIYDSNSGGPMAQESALSGMMFALNSINWKDGARKALVLLTDAGYHAVDQLNGANITLDDVVRRTKEIDPVAIYTITPEELTETYSQMTEETGGKAFAIETDLDIAYQHIVDDEGVIREGIINAGNDERLEVTPIGDVMHIDNYDTGTSKIMYDIDGNTMVVVKMNDEIIGVTQDEEILITDIDYTQESIISLMLYSAEKGYAEQEVKIDLTPAQGEITEEDIRRGEESAQKVKTPDCGIVPKFEEV